jgi:hypothetical protein
MGFGPSLCFGILRVLVVLQFIFYNTIQHIKIIQFQKFTVTLQQPKGTKYGQLFPLS